MYLCLLLLTKWKMIFENVEGMLEYLDWNMTSSRRTIATLWFCLVTSFFFFTCS